MSFFGRENFSEKFWKTLFVMHKKVYFSNLNFQIKSMESIAI